METPLNIYVFQLESNSIFVYPSRKIEPTFRELALEMTMYYDFVKDRPPIKIVEILYDQTMIAVDATVKKYMLFFDFMEVRGGSYYETVLPPGLSESLKRELDLMSYIDLPNIDYIENIINYKNHTDIEKQVIKNTLLDTLAKYKKECQRYKDLRNFTICGMGGVGSPDTAENNTYIIDENVLTQIQEFKQYILSDGTEGPHDASSEMIEIYPKLLIYLKRIYEILAESTYTSPTDTIYMKNPEFLFDDFIYTKFLDRPRIISQSSREYAIRILVHFETMCQKILNNIDECIFDMQTYEPDIEWKYTRSIYYIDYLLDANATHTKST
jgi:hypothetical protein